MFRGLRKLFPGGSNSKESACDAGDVRQVRFLSQEDPLEESLAAHWGILIWRILWTEESGGLQSMGSQRMGHDGTTNSLYFLPSSAVL